MIIALTWRAAPSPHTYLPNAQPRSVKQQLAESDAARSAAEAEAAEARAAAAAAGERLALKERELADWKSLDGERKERLRAKEEHLEALMQVGPALPLPACLIAPPAV
jgi:hypothetical protein